MATRDLRNLIPSFNLVDWLSMHRQSILRILKVLLPVLVVALSFVIGSFTGGRLIVLILVLAAPVVLLSPFLVIGLSGKLAWGLGLILITASVTPLTLPTGTASRIADSMAVALMLIALWLLRMLVVNRRFHFQSTPVNLPAFGFMAVVIISLFWSMAFRDPQMVVWDSFPFVQAASAVVMVTLPAVMIYAINFGQDEKLLKILVWFFILVGFVGAANTFLGPRFVNISGLFSTWVVAICLAMGLFDEGLRLPVRGALLALVLAWAYYGFVIGISWLAGWLPLFLAGAVITLIRSRKLFVLALVCIGIFVLMRLDFFKEAFEAERNISGITRLGAWVVNWRITGQHPLFGTGPGGYAAYYMFYFPTEGLATHSNYIDVLAQTGIIGMIFYMWMFGVLLWRGFKLWRRLAGRRDFYEALAIACFAGTISCVFIMAFGDWLLPFAYTQTIAGFDYAVYSWFFMGVMIALDKMTEPKTGEQPVHA